MATKIKAGPDWMSQLPEYLWDYPLSALAIPGSNHSFSFYIDKDAKVDRPSDPIYRQFVEYFGELAAEISYRWTVTQSTTLTQQLNLGVRYFDMRLTSRSGDRMDKNVYLRNGPNILQALTEFRVWLDMHPKEVIIIDFRVVNKMSPAQHNYLLANMAEDFFKLLPFNGHVKSVTLRNMWSVERQVIVFYPKECTFGYSTVWPNDYIGYVISEDQSAKKMIQTLDMRHQHGRPPHVFFCQNGTMTPNSNYLAENLQGTLKDKLSKPAIRAILNWIRDKDVRYDEINIIVADFVNMYDFCKEVIKVNYGTRKRKKYDFESSTCAVL